MRAIAEITGAVLRIYQDDDATDRLPYGWSCTVVGHEGLAILKGMTEPKAEMIEAVRRELRRMGFDAVTWTRYDDQGNRLLPDFYASLNPKETANGKEHRVRSEGQHRLLEAD